MLSYPPEFADVGDAVVRQCGKLMVLDRLLIKLRTAGHRVNAADASLIPSPGIVVLQTATPLQSVIHPLFRCNGTLAP